MEKIGSKSAKEKRLADPVGASIDSATQEMISRAQELGVETKKWKWEMGSSLLLTHYVGNGNGVKSALDALNIFIGARSRLDPVS